MRKFAVAMIAALPLVAAAQGAPVAAPPPSAAPVVQAPAVAPAAPAPAPAAVQVAPAPAAPAPQYAPAPAAAAPVQYAPPPAQYAAPAPAPPPAQYAPPPQYAPQAQYAPPAQYPPSTQGAPPQYAPQGQYAAPGQYPPQYAPQGQYPPQYGAPGPYTAPPGQYGAAPQGAYAQPNPYPQPYAPPPGCQLTCPPPAAVAAAPAAAPKPFTRSSWYLGFTVGGGDGEVRMAATPTTEAKTYSLHELFLRGPSTIAFDLQLGATLTPHVLLGGELTFFGASADYPNAFGSDETRTLGITNLNAVLTLFPFERGLFLRGGLGVASATWTKDVPGVGKTRQTASGGDVAVGVGYAFWLGQRFNLAGVLDWSRQGYGGNWLESTSFWRLSLGLGWF